MTLQVLAASLLTFGVFNNALRFLMRLFDNALRLHLRDANDFLRSSVFGGRINRLFVAADRLAFIKEV